jgi:hypothetical protein
MRRALSSVVLLAIGAGCVSAQSQPPSATSQNPGRDARGPACAQILQMSSSDWVAKSASGNDPAAAAKLRAIASYARCYDARTDRLAAALAGSGKGPSKTAREDFREFDAALKDFAARALAAGDPVKSAYAALYAKQFRYAFYQAYEPKAVPPHAPPAAPASKSAAAPSAPASTSSSSAPAAPAPADAHPLTQTKNYFGELLDALPDDKMHELHAAFGKVLGPHAVTNETRLAVYRYAIFLLEPPSAPPFSPPPF